jgi:hypothetical protein
MGGSKACPSHLAHALVITRPPLDSPFAAPTSAALVLAQAGALQALVGGAAAAANSQLKQALVAAGPPGAQDPAACDAAGASWRAALAAAKVEAEPAFAGGEGLTFMRHLLAVAGVAFTCGWALLTLTTGRTLESAADDATSAGVDDDMDSMDAMARINSDAGRRAPVCTRMQLGWVAAFWSLVGAGCLAAFLVGHTLWGLTPVGGAVEKAARPWSLRMKCGNLTRAEGGGAAAEPGGEAVYYYGGGDGGLWTSRRAGMPAPGDDGLPTWRDGDYCAGVRAFQLSAPCAGALQPYLDGLLDMPPLLTMPADRLLPLPAAVLGAVLPPGQPLLHRGDASAHASPLQQPPLLLDDELFAHDPLAGTRWAGWLDRTHFVVPSPRVLARASVDLSALLIMVYITTLFAREYVSQRTPAWRRWWAARTGSALRPRPGAPKAHRD